MRMRERERERERERKKKEYMLTVALFVLCCPDSCCC